LLSKKLDQRHCCQSAALCFAAPNLQHQISDAHLSWLVHICSWKCIPNATSAPSYFNVSTAAGEHMLIAAQDWV
jgi:hypothetical protein